MATAKKLPSGNWRVQAKAVIDGKSTTRSFTSTTQYKAERLAEDWQRHCKMVGNDTTTLTVYEAIQMYIESKKAELSPSTIREYERILKNDLQDLMQLKLYQLDNIVIEKSISKALKTLSPKTIKNRYSLLQHTLGKYYPEFIWSVKFPKRTRQPKRQYSMKYINDIRQAVKGTDFELEVYLGMLSLRESEIAGLKFEDIDYKSKTAYIHRTKILNSKTEYEIVESTKTINSTRYIYLPDYVIELIKQRQITSNIDYITDICPNRFWQHLNAILKQNNVERLKFHELRHIYSSLTSSMNIDKQVRMEMGGWSNERIMEDTYQHSLKENEQEAREKLNNYFSKSHTKSHTHKPKRLYLKRFS